MRLLCAGDTNSGKTRMLDALAKRLRDRDIPVLYCRGKMAVSAEPVDVIGELARACGYNRIRIESAVILVDDIEQLSPRAGTPRSGLYFGLLPFLEGRMASYGKYLDQAELARVDMIATAAWLPPSGGLVRVPGRIRGRLVLPGLAAEAFEIMDLADLKENGFPGAGEDGPDAPLPRKEAENDGKER